MFISIKISVIDVTVIYQMPQVHALSCLSSRHLQRAYFMAWAHLHKRANGHCKNQARRPGEADFSTSVNMNGGITTVTEIY